MLILKLLLITYDTSEKEHLITKEINNHEVCGYSINVVSNHTKESQQTYYRGNDSLTKFCKELLEIGKMLFDTEMKPMIKLTKKQQLNHDKAKYCFTWKNDLINIKII